jgi:hypothetical protein
MRTALGAVALVVLIALALAGGCSKPMVREKPQGDPLFNHRQTSRDEEKAKFRPVSLPAEK